LKSLSKSANRYEVIHGTFLCQECHKEVPSSRFYPANLDMMWKCKECEHVSLVNIGKERGY
jgi:ribosomal protein L37AE/L43A